MWQLRSNELNKERLIVEESLFSIGNGYIGARGCFEEAPELLSGTIRGSYINGYYDRVPVLYSESAYGFPSIQDKQPRIMDTQTALVLLDGEKVEPHGARLRDYYRILDLQKGFTERGYIYRTAAGKEAKVQFKRLASFVERNIFCYEISVQYDGEIQIVSLLDADVSNHSDAKDPRVASGHAKLLETQQMFVEGSTAFCKVKTITTEISLLSRVEHEAMSNQEFIPVTLHQVREHSITTTVNAKGQLRLQKKCIFVDGIRCSDIYNEALEISNIYQKHSFQDLLQLQQRYLDEFWEKSDIEVYGNQVIQEAVRFQLFQLLQSVGKDEISNISAKGLSGEGYEGHYFWDTEIYVLPLFQMTQPEIAKQLLSYRYHILPQAKARALELGHKKGAAYPWRTISGIECSSYFPAGTAQYHINADIAYGFIQYFLYHKDYAFMMKAAAEVILETARIWLEIGHWYKGAYHIDNVTGPDEYSAVVNNNYYTNVMAKYHLYWAHKLYDILMEHNEAEFTVLCNRIGLSMDEVAEMKRASDAMYLPYDEELGINAQDDSFLRKAVWDFEATSEEQYPLLLHFHPLTIYRYQVLKQADTVLAHFLLEQYADKAVIKRSFDYYEKITTHDSSLSSCIYGIMAAKCGYVDKSYQYFMKSVRLDIADEHGNTKDGLHMANLAGSCLGIINGFAGFRMTADYISIAPIVPKEFNGYRFKLCIADAWIEIKVAEDICIRLLQGEPVKLRVYEEEHLLDGILRLERKQL